MFIGTFSHKIAWRVTHNDISNYFRAYYLHRNFSPEEKKQIGTKTHLTANQTVKVIFICVTSEPNKISLNFRNCLKYLETLEKSWNDDSFIQYLTFQILSETSLWLLGRQKLCCIICSVSNIFLVSMTKISLRIFLYWV